MYVCLIPLYLLKAFSFIKQEAERSLRRQRCCLCLDLSHFPFLLVKTIQHLYSDFLLFMKRIEAAKAIHAAAFKH